MDNWKGTKGEWELGDENNQSAEVAISCVDGDLTISLDRQDRHSGEFIISRDEMLANTQLIAEAGTVTNECGIMPRELLEQRNELLEGLQRVIDEFKGQHINDFANARQFESLVLAEQSINKALGQ